MEDDTTVALPLWLTLRDVAETLELSRPTVHRLVASGALPAHRFSARITRVATRDLQDFIARTRI